jgi:coiled-coil-helix-coiled-coil-helix domain-containing protein 2
MYGGGGGSGILGNMAAVAGGSVIGHGISNYLYGGNNQAPTQPAEAQQLAQAAAQDNNVCTPQLVGYSKCLEANPESADSCKWAWDYFLQCKQENTAAPTQ